MGRLGNQHHNSKAKAKLPQTPKNLKNSPNEEYAGELTDQAELEVIARANAANQRITRRSD
ncbi:YfhD family protein [Cytobacillus gottheilii]|uniref:YfhD family protein n=2 Tax=Bacillaceae TaxID=186817 RepID=A0A7V7RKV4_9BACI|nr:MULTISPECIES: YfhD family protein [Bacillaceae]KAB2332014.1 YfhD family protein [Bacillus mesophilum]QVY62424.1 YfhD family protein [Cytobacillus gottheilii]